MAGVLDIFDDYSIRARLAPVLVVILIPVMGFLCWFPDFSATQITLAAVLPIALVAIFSQIGRDLGKALEPRLFELWGGQPTIQLLRHGSGLLSKSARQRYGAKLTSLSSQLRLPSEIEELADAAEADNRYHSICLYLREATRNKATFPVVYAENVNYAFRRNLFAMKRAGIVLSLAGAASSITAVVLGLLSNPAVLSLIPTVAAVLNAMLLSLWIWRFNSNWVRTSAFSYAERLLGSCDLMSVAASSPRSEPN